MPIPLRAHHSSPVRGTLAVASLAFLLACSFVFPVVASAQKAPLHAPVLDPEESDGGVDPEETYDKDSPRASMVAFVAFCRAGDWEGAAEYLELAPVDKALGAALAKRLKQVLDRKSWLDVGLVSPLASGDIEDNLPAGIDEVGRVMGADGVPEPVRIVRRKRDGNVRWLFSNVTTSRIDGWYMKLEDRWVLEKLPEALLRTGPRELLWWQWLAMPLLLVTTWLLAMLLSKLGALVFGKLASRSKTEWDDALVERLRKPMTLWWMLLLVYLALPSLALYAPAEKFVLSTMHTAFLVGLFWALTRVVDIGAEVVFRSQWMGTRAAGSLVSLGARVAKVAVIAIAIVALLSQLGYPIASILAGLGVGGLAVALAAQKTVENLFGAFSIGADQPFREGDTVKVGDFTGTCEQIGLRSTKFRTADRTLITIPNGKLAEMQLETFGVRDRLRFAFIIGLARSTTVDQVKQIMEGFESLLKNHPKLWNNSAGVKFEKFGPSSLDLDVSAYFNTRDFGEYQNIRQELLLSFMAIIERAGTSLAVPATNVQLFDNRPTQQPKAPVVRPS